MTNFARADLLGFQKFLAEKLASATEDLTLDDVIDQWRDEHAAPEMVESDLEAIETSLADLDAGERGIPIEQFEADFRQEHCLPPRQ